MSKNDALSKPERENETVRQVSCLAYDPVTRSKGVSVLPNDRATAS